MKKILLFWIAMLCAINGFTETVTFNITMTLGKTLHLDPRADMKLKGDFCANGVMKNSDSYNITIVKDYHWEDQSDGTMRDYHVFDITAKSKGNYTLTNDGWLYKSRTNSVYYTIVYNITVVAVESIAIPSTLSLQKGKTYTFNPSISHPKAETTLQWSSLNSSVATITANGVVTAKQTGSAIINCMADNGVSASCVITVTPITATSLSLNYKERELEIGKKILLEANVLPTNAENRSVTWASSNESVAVVSSSGNVTAVGSGYATITATTKDGTNIKASCLVHVVEPTVLATDIVLDKSSADIKIGQTAQLIATLSPSNVSTSEILWTSSNPECVSVNDRGIINGLTVGTATVTATTTDGTLLSASCTVNVLEKNADDFDNTLYANAATGCVGGTVTIPVKMKNVTSVSGFQFNLELPAGFSVVKVERGDRVKTKIGDEYVFNFNSSVQADGTTFVLCYSAQNVDISGNDGDVTLVTVRIPDDIANNDYTITLSGIELSKAGSSIITERMTSVLTVSDYIAGDANGDGRISVADLTAIASHLLGNTPAGFVDSAADANGDGRISVADLTSIADILINGTNN